MDINGAIADWLTGIVRELGDPSELHDHARAFADQAAGLRDLHAELASGVRDTEWSGPSADAHAVAWQHQMALAEQAAHHLDAVAQHVGGHAERAWAIVREVIGLALEIAEILLAGAALSWFFGWISDLVWARVAPLMQRVLTLLGRFRGLLADFTEFMRGIGGVAGRIGEDAGEFIGRNIEKLLAEYLPSTARAFTGFYIASAVPQLMSGRPVDWKANAWQTAIFSGLDVGVNLVEDVLEATKGGAVFKKFIEGDAGEGKAVNAKVTQGDREGEAPPVRESQASPGGEGGTASGTPSAIRPEEPAATNETAATSEAAGPAVGTRVPNAAPHPNAAPQLPPLDFSGHPHFHDIPHVREIPVREMSARTPPAPNRAPALERPAAESHPASGVRAADGSAAESPSTTPGATEHGGAPPTRTGETPPNGTAAPEPEDAAGVGHATGPAAPIPTATPDPGTGTATEAARKVTASPRDPHAWKQFGPKTGRQSLYAGLKEGLNIAVVSVATDASVASAEGKPLSGESLGVDFALGGVIGGVRQGLFHRLPLGERLAYRNQPEGAPGIQRYVANIPISWAYYAAYITLKEGVKNSLHGSLTPTELNPANDQNTAN
jgi:uncharacterized protein YukE